MELKHDRLRAASEQHMPDKHSIDVRVRIDDIYV